MYYFISYTLFDVLNTQFFWKQSTISHFAIVAKDGLFWLGIVTSPQLICDVTRTRDTSVVTSYSSIVLAHAKCRKGVLHWWITTVNIDFSSPGIHGLACKKMRYSVLASPWSIVVRLGSEISWHQSITDIVDGFTDLESKIKTYFGEVWANISPEFTSHTSIFRPQWLSHGVLIVSAVHYCEKLDCESLKMHCMNEYIWQVIIFIAVMYIHSSHDYMDESIIDPHSDTQYLCDVLHRYELYQSWFYGWINNWPTQWHSILEIYSYPMLRADSRFWLVNNREIWRRISRLTSSARVIKTKERHWWHHNGDSDCPPLPLPLRYDLVTD